MLHQPPTPTTNNHNHQTIAHLIYVNEAHGEATEPTFSSIFSVRVFVSHWEQTNAYYRTVTKVYALTYIP